MEQEQKNRLFRSNKKWLLIACIAAAVCVAAVFAIISVTAGSRQRRLDSLLETGKRYLAEMDYEQAVAAFQMAVEIDPKCEEAYLGLADAYVGLGDLDLAAETLAEGYAQTASAALSAKMEEVSILQAQAEGGGSSGAEGGGQDGTGAGNDGQDTSGAGNEMQGENGGAKELLTRIAFDASGYDDIYLAYNGVIPVKKGELWGAVNYQGEVIIPFEYMCAVGIDIQGNLILGDGVRDWSWNSWGVWEPKERTLFDAQGNVLYQGSGVYLAGDGMYCIEHDVVVVNDSPESVRGKISYYDMDGVLLRTEDVVIDSWYGGMGDGGDCLRAFDARGRLGKGYGSSGGYEGYCDLNGEYWLTGTEKTYDLSDLYYGGYYYDGIEYMSYGPNVVLRPWTEVMLSFEFCKKNILTDVNRWDGAGLVYTYPWWDGNMDHLGDWLDGWADAVLDEFTNGSLKHVTKAIYDEISLSHENYWLVRDGEKWGYIDHDGRELAMFDGASDFYSGYAVVIENGSAYLIDEQFGKLQELGAADGVTLKGSIFRVGKDGVDVYYQLQQPEASGQGVMPAVYDRVY